MRACSPSSWCSVPALRCGVAQDKPPFNDPGGFAGRLTPRDARLGRCIRATQPGPGEQPGRRPDRRVRSRRPSDVNVISAPGPWCCSDLPRSRVRRGKAIHAGPLLAHFSRRGVRPAGGAKTVPRCARAKADTRGPPRPGMGTLPHLHGVLMAQSVACPSPRAVPGWEPATRAARATSATSLDVVSKRELHSAAGPPSSPSPRQARPQ